LNQDFLSEFQECKSIYGKQAFILGKSAGGDTKSEEDINEEEILDSNNNDNSENSNEATNNDETIIHTNDPPIQKECSELVMIVELNV